MSRPIGTWRAVIFVRDHDGHPISTLGLGYGKTKAEARSTAANDASFVLRDKGEWYGAICIARDLRESAKTKLWGGYRVDVKRVEAGDWDAEEKE